MTNHTNRAASEILDGAIDPHVHGAPDIFERCMDVVEIARDARDCGMAGVILLNHFSDTTPQAAIVDSLFDDITVKGGLKLNRPAGGLNPDAVRIALELGTAKIDMPTQHAANEIEAKGEDPTGGLGVLRDNELRPEVHEILELVSNSEATVATGHLSPLEVRAVTEAAFEHGISHPVISHPMLASIDLPVETQVELAEQGAVIEFCYVNTTDVLRSHYDGWEPYVPSDILEQVAAVGPKSAILATDFGQRSNPKPTIGLQSFISDALEFGFSEAEVDQMVRKNPARVYGFD